MKRWDRFLLAFVFLYAAFLVLPPQRQVETSAPEPPVSSSVDSRFSVVALPDAPICISLTEASWQAPRWSARLTLTNCASKDITGYEIEYTVDYQRFRGDWSSEGKSGYTLAPEGVLDLETGGGFGDGKRFGKPVGDLEHVSIGLVSATFADGSTWHKGTSTAGAPKGGTRSN